jgi:hypothetical protein
VAATKACYALGPAQVHQSLTAFFIGSIILDQRHQINRSGGHSVTMPKKSKKHPTEMTSDELAAHVFHPKVLRAAKKHIERLDAPKSPVKSTRKRAK